MNIPSQERDMTSTVKARGSGTGDTKVSSLWFRLVAKRSTWGRSHRRTTESNTTCRSSHSVLTGLWKRDRQSASTLKVPGICLTTRLLSIILQITTKRTITYHLKKLNTKNTTAYGVGNPGPNLRQAQKCGCVKLVNGILMFPYDLKPHKYGLCVCLKINNQK